MKRVAQGRAILLSFALGIAGATLFAFAAFTIYSFVSAVAGRATIIIWDAGGWTALPIALALLALALALFIGRQDGAGVDGWRSNAIRRLLVCAACLLPFVIAFPLSARWIAGLHLGAQGYLACDEGFWIAPDRVPNAESVRAPCAAPRQA